MCDFQSITCCDFAPDCRMSSATTDRLHGCRCCVVSLPWFLPVNGCEMFLGVSSWRFVGPVLSGKQWIEIECYGNVVCCVVVAQECLLVGWLGAITQINERTCRANRCAGFASVNKIRIYWSIKQQTGVEHKYEFLSIRWMRIPSVSVTAMITLLAIEFTQNKRKRKITNFT